MKLKFILVLLVLTIMSGCSIFKRDRTGYEDSDSIADLEMPPELNLPKRDTNYDIPDAEAVEPEPEPEEAAEDAVAEEVEAVVEEVEEAADPSQ